MSVFEPISCRARDSSGFVVRSGSPEDAEATLACAREVFATSDHTLVQLDEFTISLDEQRAFLAAKAAHANEVYLIACVPGSVAGYLILRHPAPRRKVGHVLEVAMGVRSTHRGLGVGDALMAAAIAHASDRSGVRMLTLGVYAANAAGLRLYERHGFERYGLLPGGTMHDDGSTWDQVLMVRRVREA